MEVALRVLGAITEGREPGANDVEELQRLSPLHEDLGLEQLSCEVIREALKRREKRREL